MSLEFNRYLDDTKEFNRKEQTILNKDLRISEPIQIQRFFPDVIYGQSLVIRASYYEANL